MSFSNPEGHLHPLFATVSKTMSFLNFQQPLMKDNYLLDEKSDDDSTDLLERSRPSLPKRRSSIPRLLFIFATITTCYSILITVVFTRHMIRSRYEGPNIIYSKSCEHSQTFLADLLKPQRGKLWITGLRGPCQRIQTNIMEIRTLETHHQSLINAGSIA